jgi:hypothetical protein
MTDFPLPAGFLAQKNPMTHSFAACGHGAIERLQGAASLNEKEKFYGYQHEEIVHRNR